jgi:hypothetical protein
MISKNFIILLFVFISSVSYSQSPKDSYIRELEIKIEQQQLSIDSLDFYLQSSKIVMLKQNEKRKMWMKIAGSEMIIGAGIGIGVLTGLWVPVFMGVAVVELFIIMEGNYRLNLKSIKKNKPIYRRNKSDGKLGHK